MTASTLDRKSTADTRSWFAAHASGGDKSGELIAYAFSRAPYVNENFMEAAPGYFDDEKSVNFTPVDNVDLIARLTEARAKKGGGWLLEPEQV